ncbi:MAG TPA: PKD domain-containing protein, partial [Bacteroidetes bacterium]|nr:PKD domain-containing protein [Bacteroidota bacterium]
MQTLNSSIEFANIRIFLLYLSLILINLKTIKMKDLFFKFEFKLNFYLITILIVFTSSSFSLYSQNNICGFEKVHKLQLENNITYKKNIEKNERIINSKRDLNGIEYRDEEDVITIPTVVHIIYTDSVETNISDAQVYSAIQALNDDFRRKVGTQGYGNGVDTEIEFCLATVDPDGVATDGINRVYCTGNCAMGYDTIGISPSINEDLVKDLSRWPIDKYYNIWVVHKIGEPIPDAKGFSYLPGGDPDLDGTVILFSAFGKGEEFDDVLEPDTRLNRTLTHHTGHYLDLYDTYEGDNNGTQCPPNGNCELDGDKCCDTPPHIRSNGDCNPSGTNSCANDSANVYFVHNYMDASSEVCKNEFTVDQSVRMWDLLDHGLRSTFKESNGCGNVYSPPPSCGCNLIQNWNFEIFTTNNPADPNTPESENLEDIAFWDKFSNTPWYCYMGDNTYVGVKNESFISSMPLVNLEYDKKYELNYKYSVQRLNDIIPPLYTDIVIRFRLVTLRQNGTIQSSILLPASSPMYYDYPSSAGFPTYSDYFCYPNQYEEDNPNIDFTMYWNNVSSQFLSETTDGPFYLLCEVFYNDDKASIYFDDITFCDCPSLCVGTPQLDFSQNECTFQFSASSTADPDESEFALYSWDFGDGSPIETGQNVTHDYMWDGTYTVCLTMDCGDDIKGPVCQEIMVSSGCESCEPRGEIINAQQCSD